MVMNRTPDETKKGLECCAASYADCHRECPYKPDCDGSQILKDSLALIQQLQAQNAEQAERIRQLEDHLREAKKKVEQLQAERDAAAEVIKELAWDCDDGCKKYCKHYISDCGKGICPAYIEGVGDDESKYPDLRWTCQDFTVCPREEGTPCEGCIGHHYANFEWRGVQKEDGT